jgi:oligoribonuclease
MVGLMAKPGALLWIDLEMTGLDPEKQRIIEAAAIITGWDLEPIVEYHSVIKQPPAVLRGMDDWCRKQHGASGLLKAMENGIDELEAESELVELVSRHCEQPILLAGNSVHYDRRFIRRYWPRLEKLLHYRMLDVSAWKVVMSGKYGIVFRKPETHRALEDIKGSIEELQFYLRRAGFGRPSH